MQNKNQPLIHPGERKTMENPHTIDFRFAPPSRWTNIGMKDDFYKTLTREDGALLYGFEDESFSGWHFKRVYEFGIRAAHGPEEIRQVTTSPRFPCVETTLRYAKATLELKAFAHLKDGRRSDILLWSIRPNPGVDRFLTGLTINVYEMSRVFMGRSTAPAHTIFAVDADKKGSANYSIVENTYIEEDTSLPGPGKVAFQSAPQALIPTHTAGFRPCSALGSEPTVLRAGEELRGALLFPQNYAEEIPFSLEWAEAAYTESQAEWESQPPLRLPFQLPDPDLMAMLEACARNILQAREIKEGLPVFQVGATCYRGLWVVDGHFLLEAAHYMGLREDAYSGVDTLLKRAKPDGSIAVFPYHTKETGISVLTLIRQCELMGDDARLRELWPVIRSAVGYIEGMRREAYALPADSPCYKLLPMAFADGGLGGWRGEYTTVFWIMAGLKAAAAAAHRLGMEESARFQKDFDELLADFREHAARDMQTMPDGTPYLPMWKKESGDHVFLPNYPKSVPEFARLGPASATWAMCHAILPGEVFAPDDPLVLNLLKLHDLVDDHEGVPAFTGWIPYQALWNYHVSFGAHAWLYAGRGDKAVDYLYGMANHATPTRVWREEQSFTDSEEGQLIGDMPHNWASAEFIRLARHLVVFERGSMLELLAGAPREWRKAGDVIALENTPTRFGPVSLRVETGAGRRFTLDLSLDPAWANKPESIQALLPANNLMVNGAPAQSGWVQLPAAKTVRVEGTWND